MSSFPFYEVTTHFDQKENNSIQTAGERKEGSKEGRKTGKQEEQRHD